MLFEIHGKIISSCHPTGTPELDVDIAVDCSVRESSPQSQLSDENAWVSPAHFRNGRAWVKVFFNELQWVVELFGIGQFFLSNSQIGCCFCPGKPPPLVYLWNRVWPLWLEMRQISVLHAASLAFEGRAFALLGQSQFGKSTLAAKILEMDGTLFDDDLLPIYQQESQAFLAFPGFQKLSLRKDTLNRLSSSEADFVDVSGDNNRKTRYLPQQRQPGGGVPLQALFVLNRKDAGAELICRRLAASRACLALEGSRFYPGLSERLGFSRQRLACFAALVDQVPVYELSYPSDFNQLEKVAEIVIKELKH